MPPGAGEIRRGRLAKAIQFQDAAHVVLELADEHADVADAAATLAVHAGIAAADALCLARLGKHHEGKDHRSAVALLRDVAPSQAGHLDALLRFKTRAAYSYTPIGSD